MIFLFEFKIPAILISGFTVLKMIKIGGLLCFLVVSGYAEFMEIIFQQSHFRFGM